MNNEVKQGGFLPAVTHGTAIDAGQTSRAAMEVASAVAMAKRYPRDQFAAINRIEQACQRRSLAEVARYSYPRGGSKVTGPSIRLAECLAQQWGNIDTGVVELEQRAGESHVMAYAWDLESNTRVTKTFTVSHARKSGDTIKVLTDPRDIYEMVANQGARRMRACILGVIPGDVVEIALGQCEETLRKDQKPLKERIVAMVRAFGEFGVTGEMIEARLGHKLDATDEAEFIDLRDIWNSLRDGMTKRDDWFKVRVESGRVGQTGQQEAEEGELGLAPAPENPAAKPKRAPTKETTTVQQDLAEEMLKAGVSFDALMAWNKETSFTAKPVDADDFETLTDKDAKQFWNGRAGIIRMIKSGKEGGAE